MKAFDASKAEGAATQASGVAGSEAPRGHKRIVAIAAVGLGVAFALALGVRVKQANEKQAAVAKERVTAQAASTQKPTSKTARPVPVMVRPSVEVTGSLQPWRSADVGFEMGGKLLRVNVAIGDVVKSGASLAVLDGNSAAAQVGQAEASSRAAEASLAMAEDNLRRTDALVRSKALPEAQGEQAKQQVALAKAQLEASRATARLAQTGVGNRVITAPFDGLITKAPTSPGGVVGGGAPLIRVEDHARFRLSVSVSEDDALIIKTGMPVTVTMRDRTVTGKVTTLVPSLDQGTRRAPVEVEVPNDPKAPLLAYAFVRAKIDGGAEVSALKVPAAARRPGSQTEVVKLEGGRARFARVVHGTDTEGNWLVREGLAASDVVIVNADPELKDGDVIEKHEAEVAK